MEDDGRIFAGMLIRNYRQRLIGALEELKRLLPEEWELTRENLEGLTQFYYPQLDTFYYLARQMARDAEELVELRDLTAKNTKAAGIQPVAKESEG